MNGKIKLNLLVAIFLISINPAKAQSESEKAVEDSIMEQSIIPLVSCEEAVIRENLFLSSRDNKKIGQLITKNCSVQIDAVFDACEWVTDENDPPCKKIIDNFLKRHYAAIVRKIIKEHK
jgi:hypothetical protein